MADRRRVWRVIAGVSIVSLVMGIAGALTSRRFEGTQPNPTGMAIFAVITLIVILLMALWVYATMSRRS